MSVVTEDLLRVEPGPLEWERARFYSAGQPGNRCPPVIDITGRARYLLYGPYAPLSPGLWRAMVIFDLCPDAARRRLSVDFGTATDFATVEVPFGVAGRHSVEVVHAIPDDSPCEARILLQKAAFHGAMRFMGVELRRLGDLPAAGPGTGPGRVSE